MREIEADWKRAPKARTEEAKSRLEKKMLLSVGKKVSRYVFSASPFLGFSCGICVGKVQKWYR